MVRREKRPQPDVRSQTFPYKVNGTVPKTVSEDPPRQAPMDAKDSGSSITYNTVVYDFQERDEQDISPRLIHRREYDIDSTPQAISFPTS
jgi:hypothetical protein